MDAKKKLALLKSLHLLDQIPDDKLATLSAYLQPRECRDGAVIFEEGSAGESLFFVSSGQVRISKRMAGREDAFKSLAVLGPGDCFGEMALIEDSARSARATAAGDTVLFVLERKDLNGWLQSNPALAIGFFAELVQVLSKRLRRSSSELTLLFDLSRWLLEPSTDGKSLLGKALARIVPHLEGLWTAGAYLHNPFNGELELAAVEGDYADAGGPAPDFKGAAALWVDPATCAIALPGKDRLEGFLLLRASAPPGAEARSELTRTLETTAGLIGAALENLGFRQEDSLRARLKTKSYGGAI